MIIGIYIFKKNLYSSAGLYVLPCRRGGRLGVGGLGWAGGGGGLLGEAGELVHVLVVLRLGGLVLVGER